MFYFYLIGFIAFAFMSIVTRLTILEYGAGLYLFIALIDSWRKKRKVEGKM